MNQLTMLWSAILGFAVIVVIIYMVTLYNSLVRMRNNIEKSWANIDVLLKQRTDELPNLVRTVKGYAAYEKDVLEEITNARSAALKAGTRGEKAAADDMITGALKSVFAVAENYPQLKASENFLTLQKRISELEDIIADRREFYNDSVMLYNTRLHQFPAVVFSRLFGHTDKESFKASAADRKRVDVTL